MLDFQEFIVDALEVVFLDIVEVLLALYFSGSVLFGLFQLELDPLLRLLQFFYFVFEVENIEMEILILVFEFLDVGRVLPPLFQILDFLFPQLALIFQLVKVLLKSL